MSIYKYLNKKKKILIIIFFNLFFIPSVCIKAQQIIEIKENGDYNMGDIVKILESISNFILGISGALALLAFIIGGVYMLISAGNSEMVNKGKQAIKGALIGLFVVFLSYSVVNFIFEKFANGRKWNEIDYYNDAPEKEKSEDSTVIGPDYKETSFNKADWEFQTGIENQTGDMSEDLATLLNCMRSSLSEDVGEISSISDSDYIGRLDECNKNPKPANCDHGVNSCHYGGDVGDNKSHAVDFGDENNYTQILTAATTCGAGGIINEGDHIHVSTTSCRKQY